MIEIGTRVKVSRPRPDEIFLPKTGVVVSIGEEKSLVEWDNGTVSEVETRRMVED